MPDGGEARWGGEPVGDRQRRRFGYMPEERGLYKPMSVREHLVYLARLAVLFSSHQLDLVEDLWDEVVIVHRGRVVLAGEVDELEHRGQGVVVVDLEAGVDARAVLAAAERVAPLTHFSRELPLLSELFRQAVAG